MSARREFHEGDRVIWDSRSALLGDLTGTVTADPDRDGDVPVFAANGLHYLVPAGDLDRLGAAPAAGGAR